MNAHLPFMNLIQKYKINILTILMRSTKKFSHFSFCMKSHLAKKDHEFQISFNFLPVFLKDKITLTQVTN